MGADKARCVPSVLPKDPKVTTASISPGFRAGKEIHKFWGAGMGYYFESNPGGDIRMEVRERRDLTRAFALLNGKSIPVPRRLYWDLLDLNLTPDYATAKVSRDGKVLTVSIDGADGMGAYHVDWLLRPSGKHTRRVHHEG